MKKCSRMTSWEIVTSWQSVLTNRRFFRYFHWVEQLLLLYNYGEANQQKVDRNFFQSLHSKLIRLQLRIKTITNQTIINCCQRLFNIVSVSFHSFLVYILFRIILSFNGFIFGSTLWVAQLSSIGSKKDNYLQLEPDGLWSFLLLHFTIF